MKCNDAQARIADWIDGALDDRESQELASHAQSCTRCGEAAKRHRALVAMLAELPHAAPAPGFADRVIDRLRAAGRIAAPVPVLVETGGRTSWLHPSLRVPVFTALALLIALAVFPTTIQPLIAFVGKGAVVAADGFFSARAAIADADVVGRVTDSFVGNMRTLWALLDAGFVLFAKAGEVLFVPLLALLAVVSAAVMVFVRGVLRRGAGASYSF